MKVGIPTRRPDPHVLGWSCGLVVPVSVATRHPGHDVDGAGWDRDVVRIPPGQPIFDVLDGDDRRGVVGIGVLVEPPLGLDRNDP
ncbi:hypothetical protein GCM10027614_70880 [Micromonospora vulcania]